MNQPFRTLHALLIPEATNREPNGLIVVASAHIAAVVVQEAGPGARSTDLRRTPPVSIVAKVVE